MEKQRISGSPEETERIWALLTDDLKYKFHLFKKREDERKLFWRRRVARKRLLVDRVSGAKAE